MSTDGDGHKDGWTAIAGEVSGATDHLQRAHVFWRLLRHPILTPVELAEDPAYKSQVKLFWLSFGFAFAVVLGAMTNFVNWYVEDNSTSPDTALAVSRYALLQTIHMAVQIPLGYYLYRLAARRERSPRSYFKLYLIVMAVSMIMLLALLTALLAGIILINELTSEDTGIMILSYVPSELIAELAFLAVLIGYPVVVNRRFWDLRWRYALLITLALVVVSMLTKPAALWVLEQPAIKALGAYW